MKTRILITGGTGQMGQTLQEILAREWPGAEVLALAHNQWDIADAEKGKEIFSSFRPDFVINTAAFTNVDLAEEQREAARRSNATGPAVLARLSNDFGTILIHYSTDYVFDGKKRTPYTETDAPAPVNFYGLTKWEGEKNIQQHTERYYIIRPAWIYSGYGRNFIRIVMDLARKNAVLRFINDQIGSPTSALDLARFTLFLMRERPDDYGIFHCSNLGEVSRFDQARAIVEILGLPVRVEPVLHTAFRQIAERPAYSVLSKEKIHRMFDWQVRPWRESLEHVLKTYYL